MEFDAYCLIVVPSIFCTTSGPHRSIREAMWGFHIEINIYWPRRRRSTWALNPRKRSQPAQQPLCISNRLREIATQGLEPETLGFEMGLLWPLVRSFWRFYFWYYSMVRIGHDLSSGYVRMWVACLLYLHIVCLFDCLFVRSFVRPPDKEDSSFLALWALCQT